MNDNCNRMRKIIFFVLLICSVAQARTDVLPETKTEYRYASKSDYKPLHKLTLWYTQPVTAQKVANPWMDYALPIGNGQLGAMVYGGIRQDILQFNEKTLWAGSPTERGTYLSAGNLYIEDTDKMFSNTTDGQTVGNYYRQLDLNTGTASASWTSPDGSVTFTREYIVSYPDKCIAVHLKASKKGCINNRFYLYNPNGNKAVYTNGEAMFRGKLTTLSYCTCMKVTTKGGKTITRHDGIDVKNADEVTVVLTSGTDYDPLASGYVKHTHSFASTLKHRVASASNSGWNNLYKRHLADYQRLFNRVDFSLDGAQNTETTDKTIRGYDSTNSVGLNRFLEELYFQYGRYLLISSSRGIDLPNNLQGIWNDSRKPAWQCDMHADINVQMNYWPAEVTNLSEMHEKYLNYIYNMAMVQPQWRSYVKNRCSQSRGWVNFTENNIFGHCTTWHNDYVEAGAWACSHLWRHYQYTLDNTFLKTKALPVMLSAVNFWMDRLVKAADGTYECPNEWSPEHGPDKTVTAHAQQIVWNLFSNTLDAINILGLKESGVSEQYLESIKERFSHLDNGLHKEVYQGTFGDTRYGVNMGDSILREWKYIDYASGNHGEKDHRHLSHLMALYPLTQTPSSNPYFSAAVNSLKLRGIRSQGWSMGWKMNLWARALEGDSCSCIFKMAFNHSTSYHVDMSPTAGGVYYNLLDAHSPFQIDGNFGVCAGMAEMLIQCVDRYISLLPALPSIWSGGSVKGLRAVNNFEVDMSWHHSVLIEAVVKSYSGRDCYIAYKDISKAHVTDARHQSVKVNVIDADHISFKTSPNGKYSLSFR